MRPIIGITCDLDLGIGRETRAPGRRTHVLYDDYIQAVLAAGGLPLLLPAVRCEEARAAYAQQLHGLLIPGSPADVDPTCYGEEPHQRLGPVNPLRTECELQLARLALAHELPVFGICGGAQVLNVALGGALYQDIPSQVPKAYKHSGSPAPAHAMASLKRWKSPADPLSSVCSGTQSSCLWRMRRRGACFPPSCRPLPGRDDRESRGDHIAETGQVCWG